ncbi:MAG: polysaccharide biosynthesis/export family protein [Rikenellaceae bacterium]|nr:polysaccharide biosynthesis/export family protein [Rikenellaceae bacterium]
MNRLFPLLSLILLMVGCSTYKDVVYLQDVTDGESRPIGQVQEITIQPSDVLSISVNAAESEKELVLPFNITPVMTNTGTSLDDATETTPLYGYVVDPSGCINFPTFGKLHVAGMTRNELINFLSNKLIDEGQLTRPIVSVSFLNLKVNVLGEVNKPGTYSISSNKMTLLDAISMAGDLTIYGRRDKVLVIREEDGKRINAYVNLKSKSLFESPYFYLKQNDVIYVIPNKRKADQSTISPWLSPVLSSVGVLASIVSVILSAIRLSK